MEVELYVSRLHAERVLVEHLEPTNIGLARSYPAALRPTVCLNLEQHRSSEQRDTVPHCKLVSSSSAVSGFESHMGTG